jgi:hypothetical protein
MLSLHALSPCSLSMLSMLSMLSLSLLQSNITNPVVSELLACNPEHTVTADEWPTFACPSTGETPAPASNVRAFCELQLSEQAEDRFESIHIGALLGSNVQPTPVQTGAATGMAWVVVHSPTSITFRVEATYVGLSYGRV